MKRKIGILGGTFDPIHVGHLILAERAYYQFGLDEVMIMPCGNPPHKKNLGDRASLEERIEMVRLAIEDNPHLVLSLDDAHEMGYSLYQRDTGASDCPESRCGVLFYHGSRFPFYF